MIIIDEIVAGYGPKKVLDHLSWSLEEGMIHGLVGLNGSGKSTLLRCMYGLLKPASGSVSINDKQAGKQWMSFLETEPYFYNGINGKEYLSLFKEHGAREFVAEEWAGLFHLPLQDIIDGYSTGMKKKLALLGVIKTNKPVMMLDEPFNGLDLESSRILSVVLKRLRDTGKTIVITSHMLETLTGMCDRIHYLKDGKISRTYMPEETAIMNTEIFHELDLNIEKRISGLLNTDQKLP